MTVEVTPVVLNPEPAIPAPKEVQPAPRVATRAEKVAAAIGKVTEQEPKEEKAEDAEKTKASAKDERIAALSRKQKQLREDGEKVKAERQAFEAQTAKVSPILQAMEALNPEKPETVVALLDSLGSLRGKQAAEFMDEIADAILAQPKPEPSVEELVDQKLKAKADEEAAAKKAEEEKFTQEQFTKQKNHIKAVVEANSEKYELLQDEPAYEEQVFEAQLQLFQSTGKLYPIETLLDELEASLEQRILNYKKVSALANRKADETSSKAAPEVPRGRRHNPQVTTHRSSDSAQAAARPLTRAEKLAAAIAKANSS